MKKGRLSWNKNRHFPPPKTPVLVTRDDEESLVKGNGMLLLHDDAASTGLLRSVRVVALVDLETSQRWQELKGMLWVLTVPQRLGTMKSLGSLSVKAIRLRVQCQRVCNCLGESRKLTP